MPDQGSDVVVVGAGITGCFVAYFLARRGINATLVDRAGVGSQASGYNPGGLNPLHGVGIPGPMAPLAMESFRLHAEHRESIEQLSSVALDARHVSRIHLAFDESDLPGLTGCQALHDAADGFSARRAGRDEALRLEPRLNPELIDAVVAEGSAAVDSREYTVAISKAAVKLGVSYRAGSVSGLGRSGTRATSVIIEDAELRCDAVVLATGPWAVEPSKWLDVSIPVEPLKGELLVAEPPGAVVEHDLTWRGAALYSRPDGTVWLGGTEEAAGFDAAPSLSGRESILAGTAQIMPGIRGARVREHIAGLRPVTNDGFPIVGRAGSWDNVYLATGAGRKGMLLSAGMGHAVADLMTQGSSPLSIEPCSPERFRVRP